METRTFLDSRSISGLLDWPWHCLARLLVFSALFAREYCATVDLRDFQAFRKMLFDHWTNSSWLLWIKNCYSAEIKPKQHSGSKVFCLNGTQIRAGPGGCLCSLFWSPLESGNPIAKLCFQTSGTWFHRSACSKLTLSFCGFYACFKNAIQNHNFMEYCAIFSNRRPLKLSNFIDYQAMPMTDQWLQLEWSMKGKINGMIPKKIWALSWPLLELFLLGQRCKEQNDEWGMRTTTFVLCLLDEHIPTPRDDNGQLGLKAVLTHCANY